MTTGLPASGVISVGDISVEILRSSTTQTSINDQFCRDLTGTASGSQISFSTFYSKRFVTPGNSGNITSSTAGWSVPRYSVLRVTVYGGGGGSGGGCGNDGFAYGYCGGCGGTGGESRFYSTTNVVGNGGYGGCPGSNGSDGGGSGGTLIGNAGNPGQGCAGQGGSGGAEQMSWNWYDSGAPTWFGSIKIDIGGGGGGGGAGESACGGSTGGAGRVYIDWW